MTTYAAAIGHMSKTFSQDMHTPGYSVESARLQAESARLQAESARLQYASDQSTENLIDLLFAELDLSKVELKQLLQAYKPRLPSDIYGRVEKRIEALMNPYEWIAEEDDLLPNKRSFHAMLDFLSNDPSLLMPSISINRRGLFSASWRPSQNQLASLIFQPDGRVSWLVFTPQEASEQDTNEVAGVTTSREAIKNLRFYGTLAWMTKPNLFRKVLRVLGLA